MRASFGPHYPKPRHFSSFPTAQAYFEAVDRWVHESDRWQKAFLREVYILTRHCHFPPDFLWQIPPYWRSHLLDLWNEEQEAIKQQAEEIKRKTQGWVSPGGPLSRRGTNVPARPPLPPSATNRRGRGPLV